MTEVTGMEKKNRLRMEIEVFWGKMMKEDDRGRNKGTSMWTEGGAEGTGTEEIGSLERRDPERRGHGRVRREMEQGKRRETVWGVGRINRTEEQRG